MTALDAAGWIDVSVTVPHGMVQWPGNPPVVLQRSLDIGRGDECNVSHLVMVVHTGTHVDAPVHFRPEGAGLDRMPLTAVIGEARVIEITDPRYVTAAELRGHRLRAGKRILFRTANSPRCWQAAGFVEDFVSIAEEAAAHLAAAGIRTVGMDYPSVGGYHADGAKIHQILLDAGTWIIEGLDLSAAAPGRYEMICP